MVDVCPFLVEGLDKIAVIKHGCVQKGSVLVHVCQVNVSAPVKQLLNNIDMITFCSKSQSTPTPAVLHINCSLSSEKKNAHGLGMTFRRGQHQCSLALLVLYVDVCASFKEELYQLLMTHLRGFHQCCFVLVISQIDLSVGLYQKACNIRVPSPRCNHQRSLSTVITRVNNRTPSEQASRKRLMATLTRKHEEGLSVIIT
mmetsp:Transcript_12989/g.25202  ORF Transcript_12989/g.25202 Transcript_12989/m.25202 type:complete len:200 (-) Transcript_12989:295-894(-)